MSEMSSSEKPEACLPRRRGSTMFCVATQGRSVLRPWAEAWTWSYREGPARRGEQARRGGGGSMGELGGEPWVCCSSSPSIGANGCSTGGRGFDKDDGSRHPARLRRG